MSKIWDYILTLIVLATGLSALIFHEYVALYLFPQDENMYGELAKLVLSIFGGIAIFWGLIISNRRAKSSQDSIELARKSQIDERFKNAIEHLGSEKEPIVLGGIAELYQIAKENPEKYSEVVFDIYCSYIRSETSIYTKSANDINTTIIQTIINNAFKINTNKVFVGYKANLRAVNLCGVNLERSNFAYADLSQSLLSEINFCILDRVNLTSAVIGGFAFSNNSIKDIRLFQTRFKYLKIENVEFKNLYSEKTITDFDKPKFWSTIFLNCEFKNVCFDNSSIYNCKFLCCSFENCTFVNTTITKSSFAVSLFVNVDFSKAESISWVDLRACGFNNFNIDCYISNVKFNGCNSSNVTSKFILENRLCERKNKIAELDDVKHTISSMNKCNVSTLTEIDCEEIMADFNENNKINKLPII